MNRNAFDKLVVWKNDPYRKPLILKGARQVGTLLAEPKSFPVVGQVNLLDLYPRSFDEFLAAVDEPL